MVMNGPVLIGTIFLLLLHFQQLDSSDEIKSNPCLKCRPCETERDFCGWTRRKFVRDVARRVSKSDGFKRLEREWKRKFKKLNEEFDRFKNNTRKALRELNKNCPVGFIHYKKHCFQFVMSRNMWKKWEDARDYCQSANANLIYLNSTKKHNFIASYLKENFAELNSVDVFTSGIYSDSTFSPQRWNPQQEANYKSFMWYWEGKRSPVGNNAHVLQWHSDDIPKPTNFKQHASAVFTSGIFCDDSFIPYSWDPGKTAGTMNSKWQWQGKKRPVGTDVTELQWCQDTIPKENKFNNMNSCLILSRLCEWKWSAGKCAEPKPFICEMALNPNKRICREC